jgi:hypothetical protein
MKIGQSSQPHNAEDHYVPEYVNRHVLCFSCDFQKLCVSCKTTRDSFEVGRYEK